MRLPSSLFTHTHLGSRKKTNSLKDIGYESPVRVLKQKCSGGRKAQGFRSPEFDSQHYQKKLRGKIINPAEVHSLHEGAAYKSGQRTLQGTGLAGGLLWWNRHPPPSPSWYQGRGGEQKNAAEVNQRHWLEQSEYWLENGDQNPSSPA